MPFNPFPRPTEIPYNYPKGKSYLKWGLIAAVLSHIGVGGSIWGLAWLFHIHSLRELMTSSVPDVPPPPEPMEVVLQIDDKAPPTPDHVEWLRQIIVSPSPTPTPTPSPTPTHTPKPTPEPERMVAHLPPRPSATPHLVAAHLSVGTSHFPAPQYPIAALRQKIQGTVEIRVSFDSEGGVAEASVISSSGSSILDDAACNWIQSHWHDPNFAGTTSMVPIQFRLR